MRAVICWSMKSSTVARAAGMMAAKGAQGGSPLPKGLMRKSLLFRPEPLGGEGEGEGKGRGRGGEGGEGMGGEGRGRGGEGRGGRGGEGREGEGEGRGGEGRGGEGRGGEGRGVELKQIHVIHTHMYTCMYMYMNVHQPITTSSNSGDLSIMDTTVCTYVCPG